MVITKTCFMEVLVLIYFLTSYLMLICILKKFPYLIDYSDKVNCLHKDLKYPDYPSHQSTLFWLNPFL